jgi:hypothetical protein
MALLWRDLARSVADVVLDTSGRLAQIRARRLIRFYDTRRQDLDRAGYIYWARHDLATDDCEATLKFRHPDRYIAEHRDMTSVTTGARTKFEEDIKVPFVSLYSFSTTVPVNPTTAFRTLSDAARLVHDIAPRIEGFRADGVLSAVNDFTALERVIVGASLRIGKKPKVQAECTLIVWHDHDRQRTKPVAVELSYRYGDTKERYGGVAARRAFDVFQMIRNTLRPWVDPNAMTKTALVYGVAAGAGVAADPGHHVARRRPDRHGLGAARPAPPRSP